MAARKKAASAETLMHLWALAATVADHGEQKGFGTKVYCTWRHGGCSPHREAGSKGPYEHRPDCPVTQARALLAGRVAAVATEAEKAAG